MGDPANAVAALFVPGDRPDRFAKAVAAGPDLVIIDLEDAVPPEAKGSALEAVQTALAPGGLLHAMVRVNAVDAPTFERELAALAELAAQPGGGLVGVMLPKAEDPTAVLALASTVGAVNTVDAVGALAIVPLVESALGLVRAVELASVPGVTRLAFGALDFTLDVSAEIDSATVAHARSTLVVASRAAGIAAPLDSPATDVRDLDAVLASARAARAMGFGGKLCIHPAQLSPVREAFAPTAAEIEWARRVVDAGGGAVQIDGRMVDRPLVERARRILAQLDI